MRSCVRQTVRRGRATWSSPQVLLVFSSLCKTACSMMILHSSIGRAGVLGSRDKGCCGGRSSSLTVVLWSRPCSSIVLFGSCWDSKLNSLDMFLDLHARNCRLRIRFILKARLPSDVSKETLMKLVGKS
jgi:hypothetical protein